MIERYRLVACTSCEVFCDALEQLGPGKCVHSLISAGFLCSLIRYGYNRDGYDRSGYDHAGLNAAGVFRFAEKTSKAVTSKKPAQ